MRARTRLRPIAAAAVLIALTLAVPVLLIAIAGWPLPRQLPDWERVRTAIEQGDIPARVVINTLAAFVWIAWAEVVWVVGWEITVNLSRTRNGQPARVAPLVPPSLGRSVARLVALMCSVGLATVPVRSALAAPVVVATEPAAPPTTQEITAATTFAPSASVPCWTVTTDDTLWDIAEATLGDGARAPEILDLNPTIGSVRRLHAGQVLRLPADATVPTDRLPAAPPAQPMAGAAAGYLSEQIVTVTAGDTLWDLSEARLHTLYGQPPSPTVTVDYVGQVVATNPDTVEDPDLIYPGEQFRFPAIGTPPPAPTVPPPAAPPVQPAPEPAAPEATTGPAATPAPLAPTTPPPPVTSSDTPDPTLAQAPDTVPTVVADPIPETAHDSRVPAVAGLAGASVLASGVVLAVRRARHRAATAGAVNLRTPRRRGRTTTVERAVIAASDLPLVRWANHELAVLAERLDPRRVGAVPVAVEISPAHGIELLWDTPAPSAPAPWEATDGGWAWRILYDPDLPVPAHPQAAVLPGLVTIGHRDGNTVLTDLEALGSLAITGDPTATENLARALLVELACGDDLANSYVHTVGLELDPRLAAGRAQPRDEPAATELVRTVRADHDALLARHRFATTFQLRLAGSAVGREITVVAARADTRKDLDQLIDACPPHRGVALVVLGTTERARATLEIDPTGCAVLRPLGLTVTAAQLPADTVEHLAELVHDAGQPDDPTGTPADRDDREPTSAHAHGAFPVRLPVDTLDLDGDADNMGPPPTAPLIVRTLGVPGVDGRPALGRIELNLVTYLACAGGHATESQIIDAVWNGRAIERATLWNRISKARASLGGFIPPRDQGSNFVRLASDVTTDIHLLRDALNRAQHLSAAQAVDHLRQAMDLVTGVPFDAVGYDWAHEQQHYADACELIEHVALTLVDRALDLDDIPAAQHAVSHGLKALRVNEPLYRARMRIEAHSGNNAGVRHAYDELVGLLAELDDGTSNYTPTGPTTTLLKQLVGEQRRTA